MALASLKNSRGPLTQMKGSVNVMSQSSKSSYIRVSNNGLNGSGKTCTTALLAVALAIEFGDRAPVHVYDSSDRWRTWKKLIFDVERIPLVITYGESITVLQRAIDDAQKGPCSVFVADDLTVPWMEGVDSFANEYGTLTFDRRAQLVRQWKDFVYGFRHGEFDSLACGRTGYVWQNVEDPETGEDKLHQGDSKFNAGGGENFGYDADLELEMRRRKRKLLSLVRGKTTVEHICDVIKDAHGIQNGQQVVFQDWTGPYQRGMYKQVLDAFRPHIEFVRSLDSTDFQSESSRELIVSGKTAWAKDQTTRKGLLEELDANLSMTFPAGEGKSKLAKMFRDLSLEYLNGYISWSRMEEEATTENIERSVAIVKAARKRVERGEIPTDQKSLTALLNLSTDDVIHPGRNISLMEAMGLNRPKPQTAASEEPVDDEELCGNPGCGHLFHSGRCKEKITGKQCKCQFFMSARRGPQPVTDVMDTVPSDEVMLGD